MVFKNTTGQTLHNVRFEFVVPPYTPFDLANSTSGWQCPDGITAGKLCYFVLGDVPPDDGLVQAAAANTTWEATILLNILTDQVPTNVKNINFEVRVVDAQGNVYATYDINLPLPDSPIADNPTHKTYLPTLYR